MRRATLALLALSLASSGLAALTLSRAWSAPAAQPVPWATLAFSRSETVGGGVLLLGDGRVRSLIPGAVDPAWSPDGRRLAYVAPGAGGADDVFVADADGRHRGRITRSDGIDEASPAWSPDGMRLVVERGGRIVVIRADGAGERILARGREPAWSPRGPRIAFVSDRAGSDDLYVVRASGGTPRRVTSAASAESAPAWSPNGRRLAYVSDETGSADVRIFDLRTGTSAPLTADAAVDSAPAFAANGRRVIFVSNRTAVETLWSVPAAGGPALPVGGPPFAAHPNPRPTPRLDELLPDLEQRPPADLSIRTQMRGGRPHFLLGFDSATDNVGLGPITITASRRSRSIPFMRGSQIVRLAPGGRKTFSRIGVLRYVYAASHSHWHVLGFQRYELRRASNYALLLRDRKSGFCLADHHADAPGHLTYEPRRPVFKGYCEQGNTQALSVYQGTSVGYTDRYPSHFHGQNLDLAGVPAGEYVLVHRANRRLLLHELRYENNAASVRIRIAWPRGRSKRPAVRVLRSCPDSDRCP